MSVRLTAERNMEHIIVWLTAFYICAIIASSEPSTSDHREDLIQESVRRFLGVKSGLGKNLPRNRNLTTLPPQFVMELYEKYRSGQTPMQGNTVRSILPITDTIGEADVLIFNLTAIKSSEQILQGKLYLMKKRRTKSGRRKQQSHFRIKIGTLPQMTSHRYLELSLSDLKSEWHSYDITKSVAHCRASKRDDQRLGLTLEIRRAKGSYRLTPFRRLLKHNSQPFLLLFSEDISLSSNSSQNRKDIGPAQLEDIFRSRSKSHLSATNRGTVNRDPKSIKSTKTKRWITSSRSKVDKLRKLDIPIISLCDGVQKVTQNDYVSALKNCSTSRNIEMHNNHNVFTRKVLFSNSRTSHLHRTVKDPIVLVSHHTKLRTKRNTSHDMEGTGSNGTNGLIMDEQTTAHNLRTNYENKQSQRLNSSALSLPQRQTRHKIRKGNGKNKKKKHRSKLPFWWSNHESNIHSRDYSKTCQRKSLVVDFGKLGWSDWVLSPKSFNAHYCSGSCSFSFIKSANPSNHAMIQSLVQAMGIAAHVPTPSCVPTSTSPLTLLYFDEYGSLVLKNYPHMIVEKCACR